MHMYTFLRSFADSWYLLFMALFFVGIIAWAWRPGSRKVQQDVAASIFRNDDRPAGDGDLSPSQRPSQGAR